VRLAVVGAGSWGTALSAHLARTGQHEVHLWVRDPVLAGEIRFLRENRRYLPGIALPQAIIPTPHLPDAVREAEAVLLVVPSEHSRGVYGQLVPLLAPGTPLLAATKGIEIDTLKRMSEVVSEVLPGHPQAALCGPSFALEVGQGQPTTVVVASADQAVAALFQRALSTRRFRAYTSDDVVGAELGGALKNVIAIAAGIVAGLGLGHNTVAALITRGLAEMTRLSVALGGHADTLAGLAGLGDLVLTCTGALSRNRRVGLALGAGKPLDVALAELNMVAEGVRTTRAACALAARAGVEMPIAAQLQAVLYEGKPPQAAVEELMLRSLKRE
jgi:glycerol-3-phosphate dehydrogenase (NAD(P)+)